MSADQTASVHSAALKHLNNVADVSNCVKITGGGVGGGDGSLCDPTVDEVEEGEEDDDDEPEWMTNPQPFANLFQRMKATKRTFEDPKPSMAIKSARNTKSTKGSGSKGGTGGPKRKREDAAEDDDPEPFRAPAPVPAGQEDRLLVESYEKQLNDLSDLDPPSADDNGFVPWAKSRVSKLGELKSGAWALVDLVLNLSSNFKTKVC